MRIELHKVLPVLTPYIREISSMEINAADVTRRFRVLPDTCAELFINYGDRPLASIQGHHSTFQNKGSFITFRMSRFMDVQMATGTRCIAVCFRPGMAHRFLNVPMHHLADSVTDLADLWDSMAPEIEEKVALAGNNELRSGIIQQYLWQQLLRNKREDVGFDYCLQYISHTKGQLSVKELAQKINLSQRQLSRRFNQQVGLSTKEYARMNRFLHSLGYIKQYPAISLTDIAYKSGYYDQAHYIMDCREYTGMSPRELALADDALY